MSVLLATAENILVDRLVSDKPPFTRRSKTGFGLFALAGLLLGIALCFLIYASHLWLAENYPPETAAMFAGFLALGLAALCCLFAYGVIQYKRSQVKKLKKEIANTMNSVLEIANEEFGQPIKDNPKTAVIIASLAGFIAGETFI
ncbi:MAG: hypothetical protein GC137_09745 [Alphaproteobacteria bacterium]|nr:hypothetical protein [Alphaproteobacteria bacterium]